MPVTDIISVKSATIEGINRLWLNVYPVLTVGGGDMAYYPNVIAKILLAEQHLHLQHVRQLLAVACPAQDFDYNNDAAEVYAFSDFKYGDRHWVEGQTPLGFNWCYSVKRVPALGRTARFNFQQCLVESDTVQFPDGGAGLRNSDWTGNLSTGYFKSFMLESPLSHCIADRPMGQAGALSGRPIHDLTHDQLVKHRSIEESQGRKTFAALGYRDKWEAASNSFAMAAMIFRQYLAVHPYTMPDERVQELLDLIPPLGLAFKSQFEYWDKGMEPQPVIHYRPGLSGFDPYSPICRGICEGAIFYMDLINKWIKENIMLGSGSIESELIRTLEMKMWRLVGSWARIFQLLRFTGTPIYINV